MVSSTPKLSTSCLFLSMDLSISVFMGKSLWLVDQPFCFSLHSSVPETLPDLSLLSPIQCYIPKPGNNQNNQGPVARQERSNEFGDKITRISYGDSLTSSCSFLWVFIHKDNFPFFPVHSLSLSFPLSVSYSLSLSHILSEYELRNMLYLRNKYLSKNESCPECNVELAQGHQRHLPGHECSRSYY